MSPTTVKPHQQWFMHIDWMINWLGFTFLFACILFVYFDTPKPIFVPWNIDPFEGWITSGAFGIPVIFFGMLWGCTLVMILSQAPEKKKKSAYEWKKFMIGFTSVWLMAMLAKWIAAQKNIRGASIGDSIWAIFFGCTVYHIIKRVNKPLQHSLDLAKQTELYIATSLVLLVINFSKLKEIIGNSLFVAWIDTPILFVFFSYLGVKVFKLRAKQSMILTGCTVICGSSAATAIRNSLKGREKDQKDSILISSLLTIPCIIILPIIGKAIGISSDIAGSWFGGCVDSTGAVFATSTQFSVDSTTTSAVVKMIQNVLIAPISVAVVAFYVKNQDWIDIDEAKANKPRKMSKQRSISKAGIQKSLLQLTFNQDEQKQSTTTNSSNSQEISSEKINNENELNSQQQRTGNKSILVLSENKAIQRVQRQESVSAKDIVISSAKLNLNHDMKGVVVVVPPVSKITSQNVTGQITGISSSSSSSSYASLVWERFPKFVLGFIVSIVIFNVAIEHDRLEKGRDFIFCVSEWFSTCSFVSIGMSLQLAKGDGKQLMILTGVYLIIQIVDILTTLAYAYVAYHYF